MVFCAHPIHKSAQGKILKLSICQSLVCIVDESIRTGAAEGNEKWGVKETALMASAGARAYNGGLGRSPQRGPVAEPLVRGSGGEAPLKLKSFLLLDVHWNRQICSYSPCVADSVNYLIFNPTLTVGDRPRSHLGLRSRLDLAPKRLESRQSHHST